MSKFFSNKTGRTFSDKELALIERLGARLAERQARQVRAEHTIAVSEGTGIFIPIIPHRALDGVSLAIWLDADNAQFVWAQIHDLSWHDDLDLGHEVVVLKPRKGVDLMSMVEEQAVAELSRPVRVSVRRRHPSDHSIFEYSVSTDSGFKRIGTTESAQHAFMGAGIEPVQFETSLAASSDLPFDFPPRVDRWT